jgi:hypothetical protein
MTYEIGLPPVTAVAAVLVTFSVVLFVAQSIFPLKRFSVPVMGSAKIELRNDERISK